MMTKPVILIHPLSNSSAASPPHGILLIAACLENADFPVRIVDFQVESPGVEDLLNLDPLCIGIYCGTSTYPQVIELARAIKHSSNVPIILGGPHATFMDGEIIETAPEIDYIARYECERTFIALARVLLNQDDPGQIPNLTYRKDKRLIRTSADSPLTDLDSLPSPARHLIDLQRYPRITRGSMITSRGCPYSCIFCASRVFHGQNFRAHTPETVFKELTILHERCDIEYVTFFDDFFTADRKRTGKLCRLLTSSGLPLHWGCETRIDSVDKELLKLMYNAGCRYIFFGIESGHQATLNKIAKGFSALQVKDIVKTAQDIGIKIKISLMMGLPNDTYDTILESIEFVKKIKPDYLAPLIATPFPGTKLWHRPEQFGITIIDNDLTHYDYLHPVMITNHLNVDDIRSLFVEAMAYNLELSEIKPVE